MITRSCGFVFHDCFTPQSESIFYYSIADGYTDMTICKDFMVCFAHFFLTEENIEDLQLNVLKFE